MKLLPWCRFFRLPNLPTAPGDPLAGGALASVVLGADEPAAVLLAGGAALALYLFGLADNDITGAAADAVSAPERPLPAGEISPRAARIARGTCLIAAVGCGVFLGLAWACTAALLLAAILFYNRRKAVWAMGLCRGLSAACGAAALVHTPAQAAALALPVAGLAVGWSLYIGAVTLLSEGEGRPSEGLGNRRFLLGAAALVPLLACAGTMPARLALLPAIGCLWALVNWCAAVAPLWCAHGPAERRRAVGRTIGGLLYLQIGFILMEPRPAFVCAAAALWLLARLIRRAVPSVTGS